MPTQLIIRHTLWLHCYFNGNTSTNLLLLVVYSWSLWKLPKPGWELWRMRTVTTVRISTCDKCDSKHACVVGGRSPVIIKIAKKSKIFSLIISIRYL